MAGTCMIHALLCIIDPDTGQQYMVKITCELLIRPCVLVYLVHAACCFQGVYSNRRTSLLFYLFVHVCVDRHG